MTLKQIEKKILEVGPVRAYFTMWGTTEDGQEINRGARGDLHFDEKFGVMLKVDDYPDLDLEIEYANWVHAPSIEHYSWEEVEY